MGRVLPGLTTRTGATSVADALGTTKDQQLQNALRRAAFQKQEERKTPEGMLKFIGQAAQTAGQVASAAKGIGSAIGKLPLSEAMRNAAAAKASKEMVLPQVRETVERVAGMTGLGEGAPVTPQTAEMIRQVSLQGPQGRLSAEALGAEAAQDIAMRADRGLSAAAESELEQRTEQTRQNIAPGRLGYTSETLLEAADSELKAGARDINDAMEIAKDKMAERAAEASMATDTAQRVAEQEAVDVSLAEASPVTRADRGEEQIDVFVESLGTTPIDRQEKLLSLAQGALSAEDQANILRAADRMDIAPGPQVSDLFDPKGAYKRKLRAAMPDLTKLEQERLRGERAQMRAGVQMRGQDITAGSRRDTTAQKREATKSREQTAKNREVRYSRQLVEKARQFNATHNYRWANLKSRESMAEARNKTSKRVANIRSRRRSSGKTPGKALAASIATGIKESIGREKDLARALRGAKSATREYKTLIAKEKQRIQDRLANIAKYPLFSDVLTDGKTGLLVELEKTFAEAQETEVGLASVGKQLRAASDKYKKLRSRLLKNPQDPDLIKDYADVEDELSGLLSTYQDLATEVGGD